MSLRSSRVPSFRLFSLSDPLNAAPPGGTYAVFAYSLNDAHWA